MIAEVNSLEEMCDLMCDNKLPEKESWIFTFGCGQQHEGKYVRIVGTFSEAREKMFDKYGPEWSFQYSEEEWAEWERRRPEYLPEETLLEEF